MCDDHVAWLDNRMDFRTGQHVVVLRAMDAICGVRLGEVLTKDQPVTVRSGGSHRHFRRSIPSECRRSNLRFGSGLLKTAPVLRV